MVYWPSVRFCLWPPKRLRAKPAECPSNIAGRRTCQRRSGRHRSCSWRQPGGRVRGLSACLDGFPARLHSGFFWLSIGALGTGDRKCDSGEYENSPMYFIFPLLQFQFISFSVQTVILSDGNSFPTVPNRDNDDSEKPHSGPSALGNGREC